MSEPSKEGSEEEELKELPSVEELRDKFLNQQRAQLAKSVTKAFMQGSPDVAIHGADWMVVKFAKELREKGFTVTEVPKEEDPRPSPQDKLPGIRIWLHKIPLSSADQKRKAK